jgi:hypothetical protein
LWNIGRFLGLEGFGQEHDAEAILMDKDLRSALCQDRKARKEADCGEMIVRRVLAGKPTKDIDTNYQAKVLEYIDTIRSHFEGFVIRRTIHSVDSQGQRISGLEPYREHPLILQLYQHELDNLEEIANEIVRDDIAGAAKFGSGKVSVVLHYILAILDGHSRRCYS